MRSGHSQKERVVVLGATLSYERGKNSGVEDRHAAQKKLPLWGKKKNIGGDTGLLRWRSPCLTFYHPILKGGKGYE